MSTEKTQEVITLKAIAPKKVKVHIVGDSDLILNKMDNVTMRDLIDKRKDKAKNLEKANEWEKKITSIHWLYGDPTEFSEESMKRALEENVPCITSFGLKKSLNQAVVRNEIATYATKFDAGVNVLGKGKGLIPTKFAEHHIDEQLMSPKKGSPVLVYINRFSGWSADVEISYLDNVYSLEQIINIINLAGFGLGIGSGRSSGYGRYHVESIE